ncbi:MAG TPA: hypothetical protein VHN99_00185, partial [Deinococcales bacterium]|nr:hypothetical protein [Deinococcales bacterium]
MTDVNRLPAGEAVLPVEALEPDAVEPDEAEEFGPALPPARGRSATSLRWRLAFLTAALLAALALLLSGAVMLVLNASLQDSQ